jgi:hypothetical protein
VIWQSLYASCFSSHAQAQLTKGMQNANTFFMNGVLGNEYFLY